MKEFINIYFVIFVCITLPTEPILKKYGKITLYTRRESYQGDTNEADNYILI